MYRLESYGSRRSFFYKNFLNQANQAVQKYGDNTKDHNRKYNPIKFKDLRTVNNKMPQSPSGTDELTDNNPNKTQPDIYLHNTKNLRDR